MHKEKAIDLDDSLRKMLLERLKSVLDEIPIDNQEKLAIIMMLVLPLLESTGGSRLEMRIPKEGKCLTVELAENTH